MVTKLQSLLYPPPPTPADVEQAERCVSKAHYSHFRSFSHRLSQRELCLEPVWVKLSRSRRLLAGCWRRTSSALRSDGAPRLPFLLLRTHVAFLDSLALVLACPFVWRLIRAMPHAQGGKLVVKSARRRRQCERLRPKADQPDIRRPRGARRLFRTAPLHSAWVVP
eukprot:COSAG06_NODE_7783_length_2378_cov_1.742870_2_plen_166_part_00